VNSPAKTLTEAAGLRRTSCSAPSREEELAYLDPDGREVTGVVGFAPGPTVPGRPRGRDEHQDCQGAARTPSVDNVGDTVPDDHLDVTPGGTPMTQHFSSPIDQQHPHDDTTPVDQGAPRGPSGWWFGLLALLPIACCALPLLLAAGVTAGSGAVLGGVTGGVLMLAGVAVFVLWGMRRGARSRQVESATPTSPARDRCCSENLSRPHDSSETSFREWPEKQP